MFFIILILIKSEDEYANMDQDLLAQAFMERCVEQGEDESQCRTTTIQMFGTSGNTKIDINMKKFYVDIEGLRDLGTYSGKGKQDLRSKTVPKSLCNKENVIYYGGQCHCKLGFTNGDPVSTGCWRCRPRCNIQATCYQKEGCICNNFTIGDGIRRCATHIPKILRSFSKNDEKTILVQIEPIDWTFPHPAYCKFSNLIVEGQLVSPNMIECVRRTRKRKESKVDISWDSISFTHQRVVIEDTNDAINNNAPLILAGIILILSISLYFLFLFQKKNSTEIKLEKYIEKVNKRGVL